MLTEIATSFVPIVIIGLADGSQLTAIGDNFPTFEQCFIQAEHDAKLMEREVKNVEDTLEYSIIKHVSITCEPMTGNPDHDGYIPIQEYYHGRQ